MRLKIELRCEQFPLIILEMRLQLDLTCGKLSWLNMIWNDALVYIRFHCWDGVSEQKPNNVVWRPLRPHCVKAQIWGSIQNKFSSTESLHYLGMGEVWKHQDRLDLNPFEHLTKNLKWLPTDPANPTRLSLRGSAGNNGRACPKQACQGCRDSCDCCQRCFNKLWSHGCEYLWNTELISSWQ